VLAAAPDCGTTFHVRVASKHTRDCVSQGAQGVDSHIEANVGDCDDQRGEGPARTPTAPSGAYVAKDGETKCAEFGDVRDLADADMHQAERVAHGNSQCRAGMMMRPICPSVKKQVEKIEIKIATAIDRIQ
jgi:hypothetical protein